MFGNDRRTGSDGPSLPLALALLVVVAMMNLESAWGIPKKRILVLELDGHIVETRRPMDLFAVGQISAAALRASLESAAKDPSITSVVLKIGNLQLGLARAQDLRRMLTVLRNSGKKLYAHLDQATFVLYYVASAAHEINVTPSGELFLMGFSAHVYFLRNLLEKVGISFDMEHIGKYKSAADPLTRGDMSPEQRETLGALLDDIFDVVVTSAAKSRRLDKAVFRELVDRGIVSAEIARSKGLIDRAEYWTDFIESLEKQQKAKAVVEVPKRAMKFDPSSLMGLLSLLTTKAGQQIPQKPYVAVLQGTGPILYGKGRTTRWTGMRAITSEGFIKELRTIADDENAKALVLRLNSPGGSALASDIIAREIMRLKERIPVVASLSDLAASGGYYIAAPADIIVAEETTITGSIGVVGGKLVAQELFSKIGVHKVSLARGKSALMFSESKNFSKEERAKLRSFMQRTYGDFVAAVGRGRKKKRDEVLKVAEGRVWSGLRAKQVGLVDTLGNLQTAIELAKQRCPYKGPLEIVTFPRPKPFFDMLREQFGFGFEPGLRLLKRLGIANLDTALALANILSTEHVALMMPYAIQIK